MTTDPADDIVTVQIVNGWMLEVTWVSDTMITGELATTAMRRAVELDGGAGRSVLVVMHPRAEVTRTARTAFARFHALPRLALLGSSAVDRMIANVVLRMATYQIPIRYFTDRDAAVQWLAGAHPTTPAGKPTPPTGGPPEPLP